MVLEVITSDRPKARKHHRCYHCGQMIAPGLVHNRAVLNYDGVYTLRSHLDCQDAADDYISHGYPSDYDDGVPPLLEMV